MGGGGCQEEKSCVPFSSPPVTVFKYIYAPSIPANTTDTLKKFTVLYWEVGGALGSQALGKPLDQYDSPGLANPPVTRMRYDDNLGKRTEVTYVLTGTNSMDAKFRLWQVVYHTETRQFVPIKQADWRVNYTSKDAGPWMAEVTSAPQAANSTPPDGTTSTQDYLDLRYSGKELVEKLPVK